MNLKTTLSKTNDPPNENETHTIWKVATDKSLASSAEQVGLTNLSRKELSKKK
jgi:hypothetical protein